MAEPSGKTTAASRAAGTNDAQRVGLKLRQLRLMSGFAQEWIAKRMDVQQAVISKIENGGNVFLSTVRRYVEALGASLHMNAQFPVDAPLSLKPSSAFIVVYGHDGQPALPLFGEEL